jgi:hypothetical protein
MELARAWIEETWAALLARSTLEAETPVLFVADAEHDLDFVEAAYLPPTGFANDYRIFAYVANELAAAQGLHRFALFSQVADGPTQGFAAMLCHELRHGEQDREWGGGLWELDGHLRAALDLHGPDGDRAAYLALPTEYDANAAAAAFVRDQPQALRAGLAVDARFRPYTEEYAPPADLLAAILAAVNEHADLDSDWNGERLGADVTAQYERSRADKERLAERVRYAQRRQGAAIVYVD